MAERIGDIEPAILGAETLVVATNGPGGQPQLTAVWFVVVGDAIKVCVLDNTQKYRNLLVNDRCTALIMHPDTEACFAEIRGRVEITGDPHNVVYDMVAAKYATDMSAFDVPNAEHVVLSLTADKINIVDYR